MEALKAARDLLVAHQKHAAYLPEQRGYSTTLTEYEIALARGIDNLDAILGDVRRSQEVERELEALRGRLVAIIAQLKAFPPAS